MTEVLKKNSAASMAVVEKKSANSRGSVGNFVQFFDWNRRLSKNKMYNKLLSSAKKAPKNIGGIEKQSKLRLIALENNGGFPKKCDAAGASAEDEQVLGMHKPGVVARLMGLDSIPASSQSVNSKKIPAPAKMQVLRPQKLRKTRACERKQVESFGSEMLQGTNVMSKPGKSYSKLPSPVKSPRNHSSFKLIGAETKILEPGVQQSRLKCAITFSNDSLLEKCDSSTKQPFIFASSLSCSAGFVQRSKLGHSAFYQTIEQRLQENYSVFSALVDNGAGLLQEKNPMYSSIYPREVPVSTNTCNRNRNSNRILKPRLRESARANLINPAASKKRQTGTTDGLSRFAAAQVSSSMECSEYEMEKKMISQEGSSMPAGRKRRSTNALAGKQIESCEGSVPLQDELGALLEQKMKELKCQGDGLGCSESQKTTATILQELISAFSTTSIQHDDSNHQASSTSSRFCQENPKIEKPSANEALSEGMDNKPSSPHLDSPASKRKPDKEPSSVGILKTVSETLCTLSSLKVYKSKDHDTENALLNAEMILQSANISGPISYSIKSLLMDELETLSATLSLKFGPSLGIKHVGEMDKVKRFGVDSILEFLCSRFGRCPFEVSKKQPFHANANGLMLDIIDEIAGWHDLSLLSLGKLIEQEVSYCSLKWMELEVEAYEFVMSLSHTLVESLLDDIVTDFCHDNILV